MRLALAVLPLSLLSCVAPTSEPPQPSPKYTSISECGPEVAVVEHVLDGDTIRLDIGEKVRYLLVDTPETTKGPPECFGIAARTFNEELVLGQEVRLYYDTECRDRYGRLLAYVETEDGVINELLLARGFGEVMHIPPNGGAHLVEYRALEASARGARLGRWGTCP